MVDLDPLEPSRRAARVTKPELPGDRPAVRAQALMEDFAGSTAILGPYEIEHVLPQPLADGDVERLTEGRIRVPEPALRGRDHDDVGRVGKQRLEVTPLLLHLRLGAKAVGGIAQHRGDGQ